MSESKIFTLDDGIGFIQLIDYMGDDLSVVNDARVSFAKQSLSFNEKDEKLVKFLIREKHWGPFRGVVFKFRIKAPLYIARQWYKHVVSSSHRDEQLSWSEKSLRYVEVSESGEFYIPETYRGQATVNKQSSEGELSSSPQCEKTYREACEDSLKAYRDLIDQGVCREQARGVLVPAIYTEWIWTTSLQATLHFVGLRKGKGAQSEIMTFALAAEELISPIVPVVLESWKGEEA
jgi:thymidylate synthase (FAD)